MAEALEEFLDSSPRAAGRLARAVKRFSSPVVARRLGYLVELIAGEDTARPLRALLGASHKADALDPGDQTAPIVARWQIRTHLTPEELLEHRRVS
jgi:predicted transcriptional regulator of viral defense system